MRASGDETIPLTSLPPHLLQNIPQPRHALNRIRLDADLDVVDAEGGVRVEFSSEFRRGAGEVGNRNTAGAGIVVESDEDRDASFEGGWITTGLSAGGVDLLQQCSESIDRVPGLVEIDIPLIGIVSSEIEHSWASGADHDRDLAGTRSAGTQHTIFRLVISAVEVDMAIP